MPGRLPCGLAAAALSLGRALGFFSGFQLIVKLGHGSKVESRQIPQSQERMRLPGVGVKMPALSREAAMDHNTFAKQCDETMAAINKLTASYHHLEKPEWAKGSEDKPFSDYVHKAAQLVGAITVLADRSRALSNPRA